MNANLTVYSWAEQTNRQRLSRQAERGWLAEEAAARHHSPHRVAKLQWATGMMLIRIGTRLRGLEPVAPLAARGESHVRT